MRCTDVRCPKHFRLLSPLAKNVSRFRPGGGSFGVRWKGIRSAWPRSIHLGQK